MAYRFDAVADRDVDLAHLDAASSGIGFQTDAGTHYAAFAPMMAPASSNYSIQDYSAHPTSFTHGAFASHSLVVRGLADDVATNGSPLDPDAVPGDNTSTVTLNVMEGQTIAGTINVIGVGGTPPLPGTDADWYKVNLSAGTSYKFDMAQADQSGTGPDFRLTLYDADGNIVGATVDNGGMGAPEELRFTAATSGAYYISVDNYTAGDLGDYTISGSIDNTGGGTGGTPLAAIDWGGADNKMTDDNPDDGVTHIKVYYGKAGEVFGSPDDPVASVGWDDFAKAATFVAFEQYEHIINVEFEEVADSADADWVICQTVTAPVLLGQMRPPGEENAGVGDFNKVGLDYDEASCAQGGFSYITFIHEFGHGMGLAHPHDTGGGSEVMHGVTGDTASGYTTGDFGLNEGIFTTMSYNDGWPDGPEGTSDSTAYGYQGTLMALDVAELQIKYGANTAYHTGNDTYAMPDVNAPGTMYACIWDAGGHDTIRAVGAANSTIDLRPATLQYEEGGGGFVSHTDGIFGGFTIAAGVMIENAKGAHGDDTIVGNDAANRLLGGGGIDTINGGDGDDTISGGHKADLLAGGAGDDTFLFDAKSGKDTIADLSDSDTIDVSAIDANVNVDGDQDFVIVSHFDANAGEIMLRYVAGSDVTRILFDTDGDGNADFTIVAAGNHAAYDNFGF